MPLRYTLVDAFTPRPFAGNPAAVCLLAQPVATAWMQQLARELNLSETCFLTPEAHGGHGLRWFTPTVEVDLCGHATLAAAHVLWESGELDRSTPARFFTRSGPLSAAAGPDGWITLDFPAVPLANGVAPAAETLVAALGIGESDFVRAVPAGADILVEVRSAAVVRAIRPDFGRVAAIPHRGLIVTSQSELDAAPPADFTSRWFGPRVGVPEDPVTGSAHGALGAYWSPRLGKPTLIGYQASERGGIVRVTVGGDRVQLAGQAVTVARAELAAVAEPVAETDWQESANRRDRLC